MVESETINSLVDELMTASEITKDKVKTDARDIHDPIERLSYLSRVQTIVGLNLAEGVLDIEESLGTLLTELQEEAIGLARGQIMTDSLTGAHSRGDIDRRSTEPKKNYAALMVDIDSFKKINDTYGHLVGDFVIKSVVKSIMETAREGYVGRYGGEEFYIELNQTYREGGRIAAERIRSAVKENAVSYTLQYLKEIRGDPMVEKFISEIQDQSITVSIGVADEKQGKNPVDVRSRADEALYKAKDCGRNMVVVNGENPLDNFTRIQKSIYYTAKGMEYLAKRLVNTSAFLKSLNTSSN